MKLLNLILVIFLLFSTQVFAQSNELTVADPQQWGGEFEGTIENASLSIRPHGAYLEYGLYLEFSSDKTAYDSISDTVEVVMDFNLPHGSIIHDSWLWVGQDIMQAILIERQEASAIYEDIVDRRRDPSLLVKNSPTNYELRIFPMSGVETRKVKITYLVPAQWSNDRVHTPLPFNILRLSRETPDLDIIVYTDSNYTDPIIDEYGWLPYSSVNGNGAIESTIQSSVIDSVQSAMWFSFRSPLADNDKFIFAYEETPNSGYYQTIIGSNLMLNDSTDQKVIVVFDLDGDNLRFDKNKYQESTKDWLNMHFTEQDSFRSYYFNHQGNIMPSSNNWLPVNEINTSYYLGATGPMGLGSNHSEYEDLFQVIGTDMNDSTMNTDNVSIVFISSNINVSLYNNSQLNSLVNDMVDWLPQNVPVYTINAYDKLGQHNSNYHPNYFSNKSFLSTLANATNGVYFEHTIDFVQLFDTWGWGYYYETEYLTTFPEIMNNATINIKTDGDYWSNVDVSFDQGFVVDKYNYINSNALSQFPYVETGHYVGSGDVHIELNTYYDSTYHSSSFQVSPSNSDSLTKKIWAGNWIANAERSNYGSGSIVTKSLDNRVLSKYTAFLALEPNDTLSACANCVDETNVGSTVSTNDVLENNEEPLINAFPNPFSENIKLELKNLEAGNYNIVIYNTLGQKLWNSKLSVSNNEDVFTVKWNGYDNNGNLVPAGNYLVQLINEEGTLMLHDQIIKL